MHQGPSIVDVRPYDLPGQVKDLSGIVVGESYTQIYNNRTWE